MTIGFDGGHGIDTRGKCSPDGTHKEWEWTRKVCRILTKMFGDWGYDARMIVPEDEDISLTERCRRVNRLCEEKGKDNVILISIHNNAAGNDGKWHDARGWAVYVAPNASEKSKKLATDLAWAANLHGWKIRKHTPGVDYNTKNLAMCRETHCPAVLVENFFQDNREDLAFIEEHVLEICEGLADGILAYLQKQ